MNDSQYMGPPVVGVSRVIVDTSISDVFFLEACYRHFVSLIARLILVFFCLFLFLKFEYGRIKC